MGHNIKGKNMPESLALSRKALLISLELFRGEDLDGDDLPDNGASVEHAFSRSLAGIKIQRRPK